MGKAVARRASALRRLRTTPPPPHPKKKDAQGVRGGVEARGRRGALPPSAGARRPSPVIDRSRGTSASPPRRRRGARAGTGARWRIVRVAHAHARSSSVLHLAPEYQSSPSCSLQASAPSSLRHGSAQRADRALAACLRARSAHILLASLPLQAANYQHAPSPEEGGGGNGRTRGASAWHSGAIGAS